MKYQFHFSYKKPGDRFLNGANVILDEDNLVEAVNQFNEKHPECSIEGHLKTRLILKAEFVEA